MAAELVSSDLVKVVALLGAAVVVVPIFRRLGLGSVLGYLAAGLLIGPFGFGWFSDPQSILHVAELGVVMFLFVIGLEMQPSHLWSLRRQIFGLGTLQIVVCTVALTGVGLAYGLSAPVSFVGAAGFVLTSTAIVMQLLGERGYTLCAVSGTGYNAFFVRSDVAAGKFVPLTAAEAFDRHPIFSCVDAAVWLEPDDSWEAV